MPVLHVYNSLYYVRNTQIFSEEILSQGLRGNICGQITTV